MVYRLYDGRGQGSSGFADDEVASIVHSSRHFYFSGCSMLGSDTYEPSGGVMIVAFVSGTTSLSNPSVDSQPISKFKKVHIK